MYSYEYCTAFFLFCIPSSHKFRIRHSIKETCIPGELGRGLGCSCQWAWSGAEPRVPRVGQVGGSSGGSGHLGCRLHEDPANMNNIR